MRYIGRDFSILVGLTLTGVDKISDAEIRFTVEDGRTFALHHFQGCCESVVIEDIDGPLSDLKGVVTQADESSNKDDSGAHESATWTFYRISTAGGSVAIRWCGTSNGYYSETVDFSEVTEG